jgi:hypothetical protein
MYISIVGRNFVEHGLQSCIWKKNGIKASSSRLTVISGSDSFCSLPERTDAFRPDSYELYISFNTQDLILASKDFLLLDAPNVTSISNSGGPAFGQTNITLVGTFYDVDNMYCVFGSTFVPANFISKQKISCVTPKNEDDNVVDISIAYHSFVMRTPLTFKYYKNILLRSVYPSGGPLSGNRQLDIVGETFSINAKIDCVFNEFITPATFISSTRLTCILPSFTEVYENTIIDLSVNVNGIRMSTNTLPYLLWPDVSITNASLSSIPMDIKTSIIMAGSNFRVSPNTFCVVSSVLSKPISLSSSTIGCSIDSTQSFNKSMITVGISHDGVNIEASIDIPVVPLMQIQSIHPLLGPGDGQYPISILLGSWPQFLTSQYPAPSISCLFNETMSVTGTFQADKSLLICKTPLLLEGSVKVGVLINGINYAGNGTGFFEVYKAPNIASANPNMIVVNSSVLVDLNVGSNLKLPITPSCKLGNEIFTGVIVNTTHISCNVKSSVVGNAVLKVSYNHLNYHPVSVISVVNVANSISIYPLSAPIRGGTEIQFQGKNFRSTSAFMCSFNEVDGPEAVTTKGQYLSSTTIMCSTPVVTRAFTANLKLEIDQLTSLESVFQFYPIPVLERVEPQFINNKLIVGTSGGDKITLILKNYAENSVQCFFDKVKVPASKVLNSTAIICQVPPHAAGDSNVDISLNGVDASGMNVPIKYVSMPLINSVYPSFGTVLGGTVVHMYGTKFPVGVNIVCKFGDISVMASLDSDSHMSCVSPAQHQGQSLISISVNGVYFVSTGLVFEYVLEPTIRLLSPLMGPETGGTEIRIDGDDLGPHSQVMCEFGSVKYRVTGRWNEDSSISCITPAHAPGKVDVRISTNGQQFSQSAGVFEYSYHETVYKLSPAVSLQSGGILVTILGTNFINSSSLNCKFGSMTRPAKFINSSAVSCICPQGSDLGSVFVEVSNNGVDFSKSRIQFSYYEEVQLSSVSPLFGPYFGGSLLHILGKGFKSASSLVCLFGHLREKVIATVLSDGELTCLSPNFSSNEGTIQIYVESNKYFTSASYVFRRR